MADYKTLPINDIDVIPHNLRSAFVVAQWNSDYTEQLCDINSQFLTDHGFVRPDIFSVPGSLELPGMASQLLATDRYDIVIIFGVIVKGQTMHYEFISEAIFDGIVRLSTIHSSQVLISGILTVEDETLLQERISDNFVRSALNLRITKSSIAIFSGSVVHGDALGRTIGFPTANIRLNKPLASVTSICQVVRRGNHHPAVGTYMHHKRAYEVHLLDRDGDLYGEQITVNLIKTLRPNKKLPDLASLQAQIAQDVIQAKEWRAKFL